jgi:putative intracellular protease/amidase
MEQVLMVVTSHGQIDEQRPTGLWLEEFAVPYNEFRAAGLEVTVASPLGGAAPIDPKSGGPEELASAWVEATGRLKDTLPLDQVDDFGLKYDVLFIPGGHGVMFDLPDHVRLQQIIRSMAERGRIVGSVCHGPAALVNVMQDDGHPLVWNRTLTAFTDDEEREVGLAEAMPFLLESRLKGTGANFIKRANWEDHGEVDGNLVTGQNPQSSAGTARAVLRVLQDQRAARDVRTEEEQEEDRDRRLLLGGGPGLQ